MPIWESAVLQSSRMEGVNLTGAIVTGTNLGNTTPRFTKEQLYSTASYQQRNLQRIQLHDNDLQVWSFGGQDLTNANLAQSNLANADLTGAGLRNANLDC